MNTRTLGSRGLISSAIGLGTRAFIAGGGRDGARAACISTIRLALQNGITMLDTADFYAGGEVERMIGTALSGPRRAEALIATHGGVRFTADGRPAGIDGSPSYLAAACDASLRRLRTDCIDLLYLSRVDRRVPVEESVGTLADLVAAGKIRHIGLYAASAEQLHRAHTTHPISVLASEYSLLRRPLESGPLTAAAELGVGLVAYSPLGRGALTGRNLTAGPAATPDAAASDPADGAALPYGEELLSPAGYANDPAALRALAAEAADLDIGTARLALAWLLSVRPDIVPVPSTRSPVHAEMNATAVSIRLSPDVSARLAGLFPQPATPQ